MKGRGIEREVESPFKTQKGVTKILQEKITQKYYKKRSHENITRKDYLVYYHYHKDTVYHRDTAYHKTK